ncbi:MAG: fibrobacter succinogenes major paralogous domain-containing protein [Saprospiraceae bacterium]|nr:fibrobacter succinogenes major paralogous domain-containing protein [Candidatus Brachybacter algidus]
MGTIIDYLGGESVAGGKLKESGIKHWSSPNSGATNETGFTALPGGGRNYCYGFADVVGIYGHWWSSTERDESDAFGSAYGRSLRYESSSLERHYTKGGSDYYFKGHWFSVRLIKD